MVEGTSGLATTIGWQVGFDPCCMHPAEWRPMRVAENAGGCGTPALGVNARLRKPHLWRHASMSAPQNVIAVIFDFDDTLTDDSTTKLLEHFSIDASNFWRNRAANMLKDGWDPTLAYLKLILDEVGP